MALYNLPHLKNRHKVRPHIFTHISQHIPHKIPVLATKVNFNHLAAEYEENKIGENGGNTADRWKTLGCAIQIHSFKIWRSFDFGKKHWEIKFNKIISSVMCVNNIFFDSILFTKCLCLYISSFPDLSEMSDDVLLCSGRKSDLYIECGTSAFMTIESAMAGYVPDTESCETTTQRLVLFSTASEDCRLDQIDALER